MTRVTEINTLEALDGCRLVWNWLLPQTREATFFQTFDWLVTYHQHHGDGQRLRVLVVSADSRPIGILPLIVTTERTRLGSIRVLTYPLDGWGTFFGPIGPNPTATLRAGLRHIAQTARDWDLVDLRWVDADGPDGSRTRHAMRGVGMPAIQKPWMEAAQIELPNLPSPLEGEGSGVRGQGSIVREARDWDAYWSSRKPDWRRETERCGRRLAEQGEVTYIRHRPDPASHGDGDPRWDLYNACEQIAGRSWQGSANDGTTLNHDSVRTYLRDAHESAAAAGGVDINLLLVGGRPAAFAYNYHYQGNVYGLRAGFDPAVSTAGSGTVLLRRMVEDSCRRGDYRIDLGPDSLDYKRHWATRIQTCYHYPFYAPAGVKAQALRAKRWLTGSRF